MRIRHAKLVTALLTTTALGLGAIEIQANLVAHSELQRLLALNPGLSVASISAEPLTGRVTLHGVSAGTGRSRISIGTLDLPLPRQNVQLIGTAAASPFDDKTSEPPTGGKADQATPEDKGTPSGPAPSAPTAEAPAAPGSGTASADNVTITNGTEVYHIKHIDMTGTTLSNADLAGLFDANSPVPIEARLKKLTASAIVVPEILVDDTTAGPQHLAVFNQVLLSGVTAGRITAASVAGVTLALKDGEDEDVGSIGPIQASGVDIPQIVHVFSSVRTDEAEPILPLYDSLTITSMKIAEPKKNLVVTLATLKETGIKGRALKTDALITKKVDPGTLSDAQKKALLEDLSHSFEVGSIEATDFAGGDRETTFSVASVSIKDVLHSKIGGFNVRALRFHSADANVGIGSLDVGALSMPPQPSDAVPSQGQNVLVPSSAKIDLNQIDFDTKVDGTDASGAPNRVTFKMAHAGFVSDGTPGDIPTTVKTTFDNITFDIPPAAGQAQPIYQMGYRKLDVSMGLATTYDPANQSLRIHDLTLNGVSMGSIALGLHLVNVTKGLVSSNQEVVKASAMAILAKGIALDVVNDGLVDKALVWKAKQDGMMDVAKEKEFLIDFFDVKLPASLNNSANVKIVGSAVAKFVAEPKNLHISVESKSGLGIGSMALLSDPVLLIDSLDVKATANQ